MRYIIDSKWSLAEHFVITDESGTARFEVRGNLVSSRLSLSDQSGRERALIKKHLMSTSHEIQVDGEYAADIRHQGIFGERYEISSRFGQLVAKGSFGGWDYQISGDGRPVATVSRVPAFHEKFVVDIADGTSDVFVLAVVLAIDAIHDERRQAGRAAGGGGMFGAGGLGAGGMFGAGGMGAS